MVDVAAAWVRDRCTCLYCKHSPTDPLAIQRDLTVDHFYPQGGTRKRIGDPKPLAAAMSPADIGNQHNVRTACRLCNAIKSNWVFDTVEEAWLFISLMHQDKIDWYNHFIVQQNRKPRLQMISAIRREFLVERDALYRFVMGTG